MRRRELGDIANRLLRKALRPGALTARRLLNAHVFDRRLGVDTAGEVDLTGLGLSGPGRGNYEASGWRVLARALPHGDVDSDDVFLDYGSGKGRVVYQAARDYPFKQVIGVELADELNEVARANVERNRSRLRCQNVEIVTADAVHYAVPDDVTVIYFYNPFRGEVFGRVVENVVASLDRRPRALRIIYRTPLEEERLLRTGRFRMVQDLPGLRPTRQWSRTSSTRTYVSTPAPERD
jgi:hypothetical protein